MRDPVRCLALLIPALLCAPSATAPAAAGPPTCPGDVTGDGVTDVFDLNHVLGAWESADPAADLDGDGTVGCADRDTLLGHFALPCPVLGDLDDDGDVDDDDKALIRQAYGCGVDCKADLDHNGVLGGGDVDVLLCRWGPVESAADERADLDGNQAVDALDLTLLLGAAPLDPRCRGDIDGDGTIDTPDIEVLKGDP